MKSAQVEAEVLHKMKQLITYFHANDETLEDVIIDKIPPLILSVHSSLIKHLKIGALKLHFM